MVIQRSGGDGDGRLACSNECFAFCTPICHRHILKRLELLNQAVASINAGKPGLVAHSLWRNPPESRTSASSHKWEAYRWLQKGLDARRE